MPMRPSRCWPSSKSASRSAWPSTRRHAPEMAARSRASCSRCSTALSTRPPASHCGSRTWAIFRTTRPCARRCSAGSSCYKFTPLPDAAALRDTLAERAQALALKGTILLAEEGIDFFLAGPAQAVHSFVDQLRADDRFADLAPKESWSDTVPFRKMLVKVKREIIRMDHPTIRPAEGRAPSVSPATLRRWLEQGHDDEGREVVTLDTRNDFEVDAGAFKDTIDWRITKFTEFPPALR